MDDELVLLTSYFNLANGRRQDTADTFRVDPSLPSSTSPDGTAALYVVTESSTGGHMGPRARRLAADTIAWEYSTRGEEPPAARLKAALRTAHQEVQREFDGYASVGVSVIAVEHSQVYLAQVAPAQVYVLHEGSLHSIPATVEGSSPFAQALGATGGPKISIFRDEVAAGDVLALCASWFNRTADPDDLRDCFGAGNADDIAESLLDLGKQHDVRDASVIVIEAARAADLDTTGAQPAAGFMDQLDSAVQALGSVGRMIWTELRTPSNGRRRAQENSQVAEEEDDMESSPVSRPRGRTDVVNGETGEFPRTEPLTVAEPQPNAERPWNPDATDTYDMSELQERAARTPEPRAPEQSTEEVPVSTSPEPANRSSADDPLWTPPIEPDDSPEEIGPLRRRDHRYGDDQTRAALTRGREPGGDRWDESSNQEVSEMDQVNSRLQNEMDMSDVIPPVQAFPDTSTEPSRIYATTRDIQSVNKRPRRLGGIARPSKDPASGARVIRPGMSDVDLRQPVSRAAPGPAVWVTAAAVGILAIIGGWYYLRHHSAGTPYVNPYPAKAAANILHAEGAKLAAQQDAFLALAQQDIRLAQQNGAGRTKILRLQAQLSVATDTLHHITRVPSPAVLAHFQQPTQLAVSPDTIYVLDTGKKGVYAVTPNSNSSPTEIVQSAEADTGITFGSPQQLATSGATALVLDENNTLVRVSGSTRSAVSLPRPSPGEKTVGMANFGPDVYLLDGTGHQVWRYVDAVSAFNLVPSQYFAPNTPDVGPLTAFTLDDKALYVLKSNGGVARFSTQDGSMQPFTLKTRAPLRSPNAIFTDVGLNYLWVADPGSASIVQFDKSGNYVRTYVAGAGSTMDLTKTTGIAVPPDGKTLYVLAGTQLLHFPVVP